MKPEELPCINIYADENKQLRGYFGTPESFTDRPLTIQEVRAACVGITELSRLHQVTKDFDTTMRKIQEVTSVNPLPTGVMYDCECCELPRCPEKMKGIGYYCPECFSLCWCEGEDVGREGARFQTAEEFVEATKRLHAQLGSAA